MSQEINYDNPWTAKYEPYTGTFVIRDEKGRLVAGSTKPSLLGKADAQLMAAAPDLLKELKQLTEWFQEWMSNDCPEDMDDPDLNSALAAIQKATL